MEIYKVTFYRTGKRCRDEVDFLLLAEIREEALEKVKSYQNKYFKDWYFILSGLDSDIDGFYLVSERYE